MGSHLKLLAAVLILVNSAQDGHNLLLGRQRHGPAHACAGALCCLYDFLSGLVHQQMIVPLDSDPDFFFDCH